MATLTQIFGTLTSAAHDLQASILGWKNIGSCRVTANSQFEFAAQGSYEVLGRRGTFDLRLRLDDGDPSAITGPCTIANAGQTSTGTYNVSGTSLIFSDGEHTVVASIDPGGVVLAIGGYPKLRIAL